MRKHFRTWIFLAILAMVLGPHSPLAAAESGDQGSDNGSANENGGNAKKTGPAAGGKDAVARAFTLPSGTILNSKQKAAYDRLKDENESDLHQAFDDVQNAKSPAATAQAVQKAKEIRAKIREGIQEILSSPNGTFGQQSGSGSSGSGSAGYAPAYGYNGYAPAYGYPGYYAYPWGYYPYPRYGWRPANWKPRNKANSSTSGSASAATAHGQPPARTTSKK